MEGIEGLKLTYIKFDNNIVSSLEPLRNIMTIRSIYGSNNKISSIEPLENKPVLKTLSICTHYII